MNVNEETLEDLKCCECDCYLSIPPIMINRNYENVCGRCYVETDEEGLEKNYAFEALATHLLFPCRYKGEGCKEILPWNRAQFHEEGCEFQTYECPISPIGSCEWKGLRSELLAHFKKKHRDFILEHPCVIKPDIMQNSEQHFLLSLYGFLFLLQMKCSVSAAKLSYCVRFLGYVNMASLFDFTIDMKTNVDELKKSKVVATQENITFEKDNFIEVGINSLLGNLGDYSDISFTLTVNKIVDKFKLMECYYCNAFINSYEIKENNNCCKNCTVSNEISKVCENKDLGCPYSDVPINVKKHEKWLCPYNKVENQTTKCLLCRIQKTVIVHSSHDILNLDQINTVYESTNKFFNIIYDNNIFACVWKFENNFLTLRILSDIPKTKNKMYTCTLKLYNPSNSKSVKKILQFDERSLEFDWIVKIENDYKKPFIEKRPHSWNRTIVECYGLELDISRNDKYSNFWFLYDFPNLHHHHFKGSPILSWKNVLVISCISFFINYAVSADLGPLFVFNRPTLVEDGFINTLHRYVVEH